MSLGVQNTMSAAQDLQFPNELPPFSPVVFTPSIKHPYPFETNYSRDPARVRTVFDELVEKTKEMNLGKPHTPVGKRRARNLGLRVNIDQAKGLHWRSIQARQPVVLTAGPISPPRTPRRPATDYPSAEQLCLKNMADAQRRQNYAEACRWSIFAERERSISRWEAEQEATYRARQALSQVSSSGNHMLSPLEQLPATVTGELGWQESPSEAIPPHMPWVEKDSRIHIDSSNSAEQRYQTVVEMPVHLMDRSQSIRPDAVGSNYPLMSHDQVRSFNVPYMPRGANSSAPNVQLVRSSSMQRHLPTTSLRMAPTPLRPKIDHQPISYPTPQVTRLSFIRPGDAQAQLAAQNPVDALGYPSGSGLSGLSSNQTVVSVQSNGPDNPDQGFADDYSLKKRRSEAEHFATQKVLVTPLVPVPRLST